MNTKKVKISKLYSQMFLTAGMSVFLGLSSYGATMTPSNADAAKTITDKYADIIEDESLESLYNKTIEICKEKLQELEENGIDYMHNKLKELDPEAAQRIHKNNTKRVIRALEVCLSGEKMNDFSKDLKFNEKYNPIIIVLNREREHLYERINKRVDIMMDNGLIDEVKNLLKMGYTKDMISMQGIGYKEIIKYLDGEYTLDEAIDIIKRDSRRYAKRQLTWFRRYDDAKWFNLDEYSDSQVLKNDIIMHIEKML